MLDISLTNCFINATGDKICKTKNSFSSLDGKLSLKQKFIVQYMAIFYDSYMQSFLIIIIYFFFFYLDKAYDKFPVFGTKDCFNYSFGVKKYVTVSIYLEKKKKRKKERKSWLYMIKIDECYN